MRGVIIWLVFAIILTGGWKAVDSLVRAQNMLALRYALVCGVALAAYKAIT